MNGLALESAEGAALTAGTPCGSVGVLELIGGRRTEEATQESRVKEKGFKALPTPPFLYSQKMNVRE